MIEIVPNFSEGQRPEVVAAIRDAIAAVDGAIVLDVSSDSSHNRSVITVVAPAHRAVDAAFAGVRTAASLIDLTTHRGEHPRIGATDVVPFVPLGGNTMDDCVALARALGERVGRELGIPVYLYERAATRPERRNLADVRRGEFEALQTELGTVPERAPDFGPARVHPTAGAIAIGVRPFLVAYNVYLGGAENLAVAKAVAKAVRTSSGGLPGVKGLGLEVDGQAQVSMNLVDIEVTPVHTAHAAVRAEAQARGVETTWSEIVGLVPESVLFAAARDALQLRELPEDLVLERQIRRLAAGSAPAPTSVEAFIESVASDSPVPGGGSVAAHAGALAAALARMVAGLTVGRKKYADVDAQMTALRVEAAALGARLGALVARDADAYAEVSAAFKLPKAPDPAPRAAAIERALGAASDVPLETAECCASVAALAETCAALGNRNAVSDAGVAALLAVAATKGAAYNVRINARDLTDRARADALVTAASTAVDRAVAHADAVERILERELGNG